MREDLNQFMRQLGQAPARLNAEQVAAVLNCQPSDVLIVVAARLLKPLAAGQSSGQRRQILCHGGTAGTGQRSGLAGQSYECAESALANKERRQTRCDAFAVLDAAIARGFFSVTRDLT